MTNPLKATDHMILEFTGADIAGFLSYLSSVGIPLFDIEWKDTLSVCASVSSKYKKSILDHAEKRGVAVKIIKTQVSLRLVEKILRRPLLIIGIILVMLLSIYLPTRIFLVEINGNQTIPARYIAEAAETCGITFGANRSAIRSEIIKNKLLEELPQLQWAGINTYGCRAVISVTEKSVTQKDDGKFQVSSMIASNDGIIESVTVTKGNTLCSVGQAVKKGQVLISGYLDCGNKIQATKAEGEIFAHTSRSITILSPLNYKEKGSDVESKKKYSLILGKNRINLSKDSGISIATCDKMYKEYPLILPGGFVLPVALAVEQWNGYNKDEQDMLTNGSVIDLSSFAALYLQQQMISGRIVSKAENIQHTNDTVCLKGVYNCLEMIGRERTEEIIDGKDH